MSDDEEQWRRVPGAGLYEVSDRGRVKSRRSGNGQLLPEGEWRECKLSNHPKGYLSASIDGRLRLVHDLVLLAFVGEPAPGQMACHFPDPSHTNNNLSNLRWGSGSDNSRDAALHGTLPRQRISAETALVIRNRLKQGERGCDIAEDLKLPRKIVYNVSSGRCWAWLKPPPST